MEQVPDVDAVLVPVGGAGLIAGVALAVKSLAPDVKVYVNAHCVDSLMRLVMAALRMLRILYFRSVVSSSIFYLFSLFFSSPNLNRRRLDVYHTSTHGVALVRI